MRQLVAKFEETETSCNKKSEPAQLVLNHESVRKILKLYKFHPYKIVFTQERTEMIQRDELNFSMLRGIKLQCRQN